MLVHELLTILQAQDPNTPVVVCVAGTDGELHVVQQVAGVDFPTPYATTPTQRAIMLADEDCMEAGDNMLWEVSGLTHAGDRDE